MLRWRLLSASVIIALCILFLYLDYRHPILGVTGLWLLPWCLALTMLSTNEVLSMLHHRTPLRNHWPAYVASFSVVAAACVPTVWHAIAGEPYPADCPLGPFGWPLAAAVISAIGIFVVEIFQFKEPGQSINQVALSSFVMVYAGLTMVFIVGLRLWGSHTAGMVALLSMIFITKMSDAGAYTFGRLLGRNKLAPALSPGKTIEGSLGGLFTGCVSSILFFTVMTPLLFGVSPSAGNVLTFALYGVVVAISGMIGDLAESLLKRDSQQKDSSTWMPGLGGVMDVMDSLLFAALPAYLCWLGKLIVIQ